jgi:flagellar motility protein MotE (MotC chaperone)
LNKIINLFLLINIVLFAREDSYKCNQIFEQRKQELIRELERIDNNRAALKVLQNATQSMLSKREEILKKKEEDLRKREKIVIRNVDRTNINLKKNQKVLSQIKKSVKNKTIKTLEQIGTDQAANIFEKMPTESAASILFDMKPKKIGEILSKMNADFASKLIILLQNGPPFKNIKKDIGNSESNIINELKKGLDY